jgi:anti-sigma regulatory factor (Ser/Thr protein kinase)
MQDCIAVAERSAVAEARRRAVAMAEPLSFDEDASGRLALAVTEAATNLVRHAGGGYVLLRALAREDAGGVEVIAFDKGPGIANVAASMRDGVSTQTSPGLGLGSLRRLTTDFELYSQPGRGTVARFEAWPTSRQPRAHSPVQVGAVCVAKRGENVAGDDWAFRAQHDRCAIVVADGLGHGPEAAQASRVACATATEEFARAPAEQIAAMHAALRPTRGAAAAVAVLRPAHDVGAFCGVGNISALARVGATSRSLVSHNGTLGHHMRKAQEFAFPFPRGGLLIMHSDGINTHWDLSQYPGLTARHPAVIAAVLFRDCQRGNDDATVVVARLAGPAGE